MFEADFSWALQRIKLGNKLRRERWNGKGLAVYLTEGELYQHGSDAGINLQTLVIESSESFNTWVPSISDILAIDWQIVE